MILVVKLQPYSCCATHNCPPLLVYKLCTSISVLYEIHTFSIIHPIINRKGDACPSPSRYGQICYWNKIEIVRETTVLCKRCPFCTLRLAFCGNTLRNRTIRWSKRQLDQKEAQKYIINKEKTNQNTKQKTSK